ncbi:DISARM system phospholipase D-like protein DrmC [Demequina sp. SO4-18]|uniref:DISARM system phospholipase D-like protein DrmC n=1 Tax=Demequina sp. SO4-18 TaxID=3401026 RepID=UPI003B58C2C9
MGSSPDLGEAMRRLGEILSGTEARLVASSLDEGESFGSALSVLRAEQRAEVSAVAVTHGLRARREVLVAALWAIEGAKSQVTSVDAIWTMPGHLAQSGALTGSLVDLVRSARRSVVASTFNFQETSGMWSELQAAATRDGVIVTVYIDADAAGNGYGPSAREISANVSPGEVYATKPFDGKNVRNHAKFVSVDHRFVVVTSANMSWSAENANVELGVRVDDAGFAERLERQLRAAASDLYRRIE